MLKNTPGSNNQQQLQQPVTVLKGVGPQLAAKLDKLGLTNVQDLLFHLAFRFSPAPDDLCFACTIISRDN